MKKAHEDREQQVDKMMITLKETRSRKTEPWWTIYFLLLNLSTEAVTALVSGALTAHATGEMRVADGTRQRTLGGVFFALAKAMVGRGRWNHIVRLATQAWARRWLRKIDEAGPRPATPTELEDALRALDGEPSDRGLRVFLELAAAPTAAPKAARPAPEPVPAPATTTHARGKRTSPSAPVVEVLVARRPTP